MIRSIIQQVFPQVIIMRLPPDQPLDARDQMFHAMFHVLVEWFEVTQPFTSPEDKTFHRQTDVELLSSEVMRIFNTPDNLDFLQPMLDLVDLYRWYKARSWDISHVQFTDIAAYATAEEQIERHTKRLLELREYLA